MRSFVIHLERRSDDSLILNINNFNFTNAVVSFTNFYLYKKKKLVGNAILSRSIEKTFLGNNTFEGFNKLFSALL